MNKSIFIFSLDVESAWGFMLYPNDEILTKIRMNRYQVGKNIDSLLELLNNYNISATWAVVGHLFLNQDDSDKLIHKEMPQFKEGWINWNDYKDFQRDNLYYGNNIIQNILKSPITHEIALHGFFHIPFSDCSRNVAKAEMDFGIKAANKMGIEISSFIFPENKIGHVDILKDYGIKIYRSKDVMCFNGNQTFPIRKLNNLIYKLISRPILPSFENGIWNLPSSTHFCDPQMPFSLLPRSKIGLYRAIKTNKIFHIWLHPWSLIFNKSLYEDLEEFLALVAKKRGEGKIEIKTMGELAQSLALNR